LPAREDNARIAADLAGTFDYYDGHGLAGTQRKLLSCPGGNTISFTEVLRRTLS
jgi:hypothetical protein